VSALDPATTALVLAAAAMNDADEAAIERRLRAALEAGADPVWLDELILAGVLVVGFPRALVFAGVLRRLVARPPEADDGADYEHWRTWARRGAETCHAIYRANYTKLRENVARLHPVLDPWIVVDGYGRILSRPGLDVRRRELCSIAVLVAQGVPRQLHSHLRGALNVGASEAEVDGVLDALESSGMVPAARMSEARTLWSQTRPQPPAPGT
jgi:4-carboxymuconolactone decarboxylase